jgi:hypothetical protein
VNRDNPILELARTIRAHLSTLLGNEAEELDAELARLLASSDQADVSDEVLAVLRRHQATHDWAARFLETGQPPGAQGAEKGLPRLPGSGEVVRSDRYICSDGDYVWYKRSVGEAIPDCPTHRRPLRREGQSGC